jgi:hypothetical protein
MAIHRLRLACFRLQEGPSPHFAQGYRRKKMGRHGPVRRPVRRSLGEGGSRTSLPLGQVLLSMRTALRAIWRYALSIYHSIELLDRIAYTNAGFNLHC